MTDYRAMTAHSLMLEVNTLLTSTGDMERLRRAGHKFSNALYRKARILHNHKGPVPAATVGKPAIASTLPPEVKAQAGGRVKAPDHFREQAKGKRFILTSAQNNTKVHAGFWKALNRMADKVGAQIMVSRFSYNKNGWGGVTKDSKTNAAGDELWYDPAIIPYVQNDQIKLARDFVFCAELDILPTAKDPLSGLENYTATNSAAVPHAKVHMHSMAGLLSGQPQRFMYTTGTCTLRNYIERRAGQIASYHHVYGALYLEIDNDGDWFARQINANDDGSFFDLNSWYGPNSLEPYLPNGPAKIINLGDIHAEKMDPVAFKGAMDFVRYIKPSHIAIHDLLDFEARNHHNIKDPFFRADQHFNGMNTVEGNIKHAVTLLEEIGRNSGAELLLVRSNHDMAFMRWLKEAMINDDPANSKYYHRMMYLMFEGIEQGVMRDMYEIALLEAADALDMNVDKWVHIKEDDSYVLHEIELGLHGHLGPNGAKGSPKGYRQLGRKLNTGHTHSAGIIDGVWTAGVLASLNMGYNKGPSSWSQSHILTHENGKRQMITQRGEKWRAV